MSSNQQILEKAIQKAIDGGWELPNESWQYEVQSDRIIILTSMAVSEEGYEEAGTWRVSTYEIIFNHDFAKAVGYKLADLGAWCDEGKDPIEYLAKVI